MNQHGHIHWILPPTVRCQNNLSQPTSRVEFHNSNLRIHRYKVSPKPKSNSPQPQLPIIKSKSTSFKTIFKTILKTLTVSLVVVSDVWPSRPSPKPRNLRILLQDIDATVSHVRLVAVRKPWEVGQIHGFFSQFSRG